ncbi:MAG: cytochrome c5 family protein [Ignavibacteriae bacterium]|nr:cytochrome c5 family protein [Ignavibacteriota bacterium]
MKFYIIVILFISSLFVYANSFYQEEKNVSGKDVFDKTCESCHTGGFKGWMTGAPEIGDWDDWESYFEKDLSEMTKNVIEGTEGHEVKGDCSECTDEQIKVAIEYIMSVTKNEDND